MTRPHLSLRVVLATGAVLAALSTAGCSSTMEVTATPDPAMTTGPLTENLDPESCAGFVDVMTIRHNVDAAVHDGRMSEQEQDGWYALASRVLEGAPTSGEGPISDALVALQEAVPAASYDSGSTVDFQTDAANAAGAALREACEAEGYETGAHGFVGG